MPFVMLVADGQEHRGVGGFGSQIADGGKLRGLLSGDRDVEADRAAHVHVVGGVVAVEHVGDKAVGGGESQESAGSRKDVCFGAQGDGGHDVFSVRVLGGAPVSAGGAANRLRVGGQP